MTVDASVKAAGRAVVVEDDRSWQAILTEILTDAGLVVDVADNMDAAVACLRAVPHHVAVVDLSLAGADHRNRDGLAVLEAVRRHDPNCAAILLSGHATVELAVAALTRYGALTCLRKEAFRRSEFRRLVAQALASGPAQLQSLDVQRRSQSGERPHAARRPEQEGVTPALPARSPVEDRRALLVEDDAGWRSVLTELLADTGYQVQSCPSYGEALSHLRHQSFQLAVVDLSLASSLASDLPGNSHGVRVLEVTRRNHIPSLVVSGSADLALVDQVYRDYGAIACLEKRGFDRQAFYQAVRRAEDAAAASTAGNRLLADLTDREREVLALLVQGLTNRQIGEVLVISANTVKRHLKAIFAKLDVTTRAAASAKAVAAGLQPVTSDQLPDR